MEGIRELQKRYCSRAILIAVFAWMVFYVLGLKSYGAGLLLGTLFSIVNFVAMGETLPLKLGLTKNKTYLFALLSILFRYGLLALPLILSIKFDRFDMVTTIVGLFMIQLLILYDHVGGFSNFSRKETM